MEREDRVSRRGYYYDLDLSPYGYTSPYGDFYKLPSAKRLDMMQREAKAAMQRIDKLIERNDLGAWVPKEIIILLHKAAINAVYDRLVR